MKKEKCLVCFNGTRECTEHRSRELDYIESNNIELQYIPADDNSVKIKYIKQVQGKPDQFWLEICYKMDSMLWTGAIHKTYINKNTGYITGYDVKLY